MEASAPDFKLQDLSGRTTSLSDCRGYVVILDFWATWCPPCKKSIKELVKLQRKYRKKGLKVLGISMDDPERATDKHVSDFLKKHRVNYAVFRHNQQLIEDYLGNNSPALPTMFLIDREGKIKHKLVGFFPGVLEEILIGILQ